MAFQLAILHVNGYTFDGKNPKVEAVGVEGPYIKEVGTVKEIKENCSSKTMIINGEGKTLLPGFSDAHTHFADLGIRMAYYVHLDGAKNKREILQVIAKETQKRPHGEWITGVAWDESKWEGDRSIFSKGELDRVAPSHPVVLIRVDGHISCVNSKALRLLGFTPKRRGVETKDGEPTGVLVEDAAYQVRLHIEPNSQAIAKSLKAATKKAHSLGVTSIHDIWVNREKLKAYQYLQENQELKIRVGVYLEEDYIDDLVNLGLYSLGDDFLRLLGIKLFMDGSIGAKTAMVKDGYRDNPHNKGYPLWEEEDLLKFMKKASTNHIKMAIHAIGDGAVEEALKGLEDLEAGHRIEHLALISLEQIKRMKRLGIKASMQPNFIGEWGLPGSMYEDRFGPEVIKTMYPLRKIVDEGITLLLGSDGMPFDPLYGIHWAVNAPFPCQRLTPEEAIRGYTRSAAGEYPGIIRKGGLADMVLLDSDPLQDQDAIKGIGVFMTIFHGQVVYGV